MSTQKKKMVPNRNYAMIAGIYAVVIIAVLYFASWYNTYQEYQKETPVLRNTLFEINQDEIEHYLMENPSCVIYMCSATNDNCRSFEMSFKKEILKHEWQDKITYLNLSSIQNQDYYLSSFVSQYVTSDFEISRMPALVAFEDGKVVATISGVNDSIMTVNEAKQFVEDYKVEN